MQTTQSMVVTTGRAPAPDLHERVRPATYSRSARKRSPACASAIFLKKSSSAQTAAELQDKEQVVDKETTMTLKTGEKIDIALSLSKIRGLAQAGSTATWR